MTMPNQAERRAGEASRLEVAEYIHEMTGQLAEMARNAGMLAAAEALDGAQRVIEGEA
ncbi:MAG: hypothetical protein JNK94_01890 [Hyphomonadaceae bacterium]|nr:hypothetical protein [Hyphomonadaceae bacterium]